MDFTRKQRLRETVDDIQKAVKSGDLQVQQLESLESRFGSMVWQEELEWDGSSSINQCPVALQMVETMAMWSGAAPVPVEEVRGAMEYLIKRMPQPNPPYYPGGETPLHTSARYKTIAVAESLLLAGADPNTLDKSGQTALQVARDEGGQDGFEVVLQDALDKLEKDERLQNARLKTDAEKIIEGRSVLVTRINFYFLGLFGTGKSNLVRATLGEEFAPVSDSTEGLRVSRNRLRLRVAENSASLLEDCGGGVGVLASIIAEHLSTTKQQRGQEKVRQADREAEPQRPSVLVRVLRGLRSLINSPAATHSTMTASAPATSPGESGEGTGRQAAAAASDLLGAENYDGLPDELISRLKKHIERDDGLQGPEVYIDTLDFGGQLPMSIQQSLVLKTRQSIFIYTMKAIDEPSATVTKEVFRLDGKEYTAPPPIAGMTRLDHLRMWLSMLLLCTTQDDGDQPGVVEPVDVFIVVTHVDMVTSEGVADLRKRFKTAVNEVTREVNPDGGDIKMNVIGPFFVDNQRRNVHDMPQLLQELRTVVERAKPDDVPLLRLKVENAITAVQQAIATAAATDGDSGGTGSGPRSDSAEGGSERSGIQAATSSSSVCMLYRQFRRFCSLVTNDKMASCDVKDTLASFHSSGIVFYNKRRELDDDTLVFIYPVWLLQEFVRVLACGLKPDEFATSSAVIRNQIAELRRTGVAGKELLQFLWRHFPQNVRDALLGAMEYFNMASINGEDGSVFIPFAACDTKEKAALPENSSSVLPEIRLSFPCLFFPPPMFGHLSAHVLSKYKPQRINFKSEYAALSLKLSRASNGLVRWSPGGLILQVSSTSQSCVARDATQLLQCVREFESEIQQRGYGNMLCSAYGYRHSTCTAEHGSEDRAWIDIRDDDWKDLAAEDFASSNYRCDRCRCYEAPPPNFASWKDPSASISSDAWRQRELRDVENLEDLAQKIEWDLPLSYKREFAKKLASLINPGNECERFANVITIHIQKHNESVPGNADVCNVHGVLHWAAEQTEKPRMDDVFTALKTAYFSKEVAFRDTLSKTSYRTAAN